MEEQRPELMPVGATVKFSRPPHLGQVMEPATACFGR